MNYTNVNHDQETLIITATLGDKNVTIHSGNGVLYSRTIVKQAITYSKITFHNRLLEHVEQAILYPTASNLEAIKDVYIRKGWLDKELANLDWLSLSDYIIRFRNKSLDRKEMTKFRAVLNVVSLSVKQVRKTYALQTTECIVKEGIVHS